MRQERMNRRFSLFKFKMLFLLLMPVLFFGCASTPKSVMDDNMIYRTKKLMDANKIIVAPLKVAMEYYPCLHGDTNQWIAKNKEIWNPEIALKLQEKLKERGSYAEIIEISENDFRNRISVLLRANGKKGFYDAQSGQFSEELFDTTMKEIAKQYNAILVLPRLIVDSADFYVSGGSLLALVLPSPNIGFAGVSRPFMTFGAKFERGLGGADLYGEIPVLELKIRFYHSDIPLYSSYGGYDVLRTVGDWGGTTLSPKSADDLFKTRDAEVYLKEAVSVAVKKAFTLYEDAN